MSECPLCGSKRKPMHWTTGLPVRISNTLMASGFQSEDEIAAFMRESDIEKITGIGVSASGKIKSWLIAKGYEVDS